MARRLGLTMEGENWSSSSRAPQLASPLFRKGQEKKFQNIMSVVRDGLTCNFFDYSYRLARTGISQTVAAFTQDIFLPVFEVFPLRTASQRAAASPTPATQAIEFDFHPTFSTRFRLFGHDAEKVRALFTPRVVFFLERLDPDSTWRFEGSDFTLIIYHSGETVNPSEYPAFIEETTELAKAFLGIVR